MTAGACLVDPVAGPPGGWFVETRASQISLAGEPWRIELLQALKDQNSYVNDNPAFREFNTAIERTSWIRKCAAKFHTGDPKAR